MADKAEEAAKLMKKANKYLGPSIIDFRMKPDWEQAAPLLDRAALLFQQAGDVDRALEAYEKAATAQEKIGSTWHAAKHMESAAELAKRHKRWEKVVECYKVAAEFYLQSGKHTQGADSLARGAKAVEENDSDGAMTLLFDAVDIYENCDQLANGQDVFRQAIATAIKAKLWHDAVDLQMRLASYSDRTGAHTTQCRCYLGAVVTHLYAKEPKEAWRLFQDALLVDAFVSSEEAFAADALFSAYVSGDEEAVKTCVQKKSVFKQLDNHVARIAMRLPQGQMDKMARRLNRAMGGGGSQAQEDGNAEDDPYATSGGRGKQRSGRRRGEEEEEEGEEEELL